jgi:uncharacterized protein (TIGR01244 family)
MTSPLLPPAPARAIARRLALLPPFALALACTLALPAQRALAQRLTGTGRITTLPAPVGIDTTGRFLAAAVRVGDDIYISGQPTALALKELRALGVTTVINLRMPQELARSVDYDEPKTIADLGMTYVPLPVRGTSDAPYSPETVTKFAEAVAKAPGKVLLHCTVAWRASHLWAAYLIRERGVPVETALTHTRAINLMDDHRMGPDGRQPVEDFLDRALPTLRRPPAPAAGAASGSVAASVPAAAAASQPAQPARPTINGGLPEVSPDGRQIAFVRQGPGVTAGLYVIGADGTGERRIADAPDGRARWLPDGSGLYFGVGKFTDDSSDIRRVSLAGGAPVLIERIPARDVAMTADGKAFYGSSGTWPNLSLVHIPIGSHEMHRLTPAPGAFFNTAIGPNERLAFAYRDSTRRMQVFTIAPGKGLVPLTAFAASQGSPQWPSWSPDGKQLAVQAGTYGQPPERNTSHIYLVDVATGKATALAPHERAYLDETPSFFPDGRTIAFQSNRTGRMEIWVMQRDGTGARQVTR